MSPVTGAVWKPTWVGTRMQSKKEAFPRTKGDGGVSFVGCRASGATRRTQNVQGCAT